MGISNYFIFEAFQGENILRLRVDLTWLLQAGSPGVSVI